MVDFPEFGEHLLSYSSVLIFASTYRLAKQNDLSAIDYYNSMMDNIDEVTDKRIKALNEIEKDKLRVDRAYNRKVKDKSFQIGDLVWKTILPLGMKNNKFGK